MASPQLENGYTKIANDILDEILKWHFSPYELRVLFLIIRKTYGWNKKNDWISLSQFVESTKIKKQHVCRALKMLQKQNIVTKGGNRNQPKYGIQKDYELWVVLPKGVRSHHELKVLPKGVIQGVPKGGHTKETITKEIFAKAKNKPSKGNKMKTWNEETGEWNDNRRKGKPKPNPLREKAEDLLKAYYKGFLGTIVNDMEKVPRIPKEFYLKQAYGVLKIYSLEELKGLLPIFFGTDFYKSTTWAVSTFLSFKVLNSLKTEHDK